MIDDELQSKFSAYINEFKMQSIDIKREEIINSLKELISIIDIICQREEISVEYLKYDEIKNSKYQNVSEDAFLESCLVYLENLRSIISKYFIYKDIV